jgi:SAM-dependent methyltransferase
MSCEGAEMGVSEKFTEIRWRLAGHRRRLPASFVTPLEGARALEIGGPSAVFGADGLLPIYPVLAHVDGVQWAAETVWHSLDSERGYRPDGDRVGDLHVLDSVDLDPIADGSYDAVVSSHVLEHIANPLRALAAWRRVTRPSGHLLTVAPHMSGTFDHRRAVTPLSHMIDDLERNVGEGDLTHLEETLGLHDRTRDSEAADQEAWAARRRSNLATRVLHHHTFTTFTLLELLDHAGLELIGVETRFPHDIYVLGRWPSGSGRADNSTFLAARHRSPFRVDHE